MACWWEKYTTLESTRCVAIPGEEPKKKRRPVPRRPSPRRAPRTGRPRAARAKPRCGPSRAPRTRASGAGSAASAGIAPASFRFRGVVPGRSSGRPLEAEPTARPLPHQYAIAATVVRTGAAAASRSSNCSTAARSPRASRRSRWKKSRSSSRRSTPSRTTAPGRCLLIHGSEAASLHVFGSRRWRRRPGDCLFVPRRRRLSNVPQRRDSTLPPRCPKPRPPQVRQARV